MIEVSRDTAAAGEEQLASCAAEKSKYCSICTVTLGPCGDLPFTSWGLWQCLRGGAGGLNGYMPPAISALNIDVGPCRGSKYGGMLEAMVHCPFAAQRGESADCPSQKWHHFTRPKLPGQNSREKLFGRRFKIALEGPNRFKRGSTSVVLRKW
jgi:hypothetical protein